MAREDDSGPRSETSSSLVALGPAADLPSAHIRAQAPVWERVNSSVVELRSAFRSAVLREVAGALEDLVVITLQVGRKTGCSPGRKSDVRKYR